MDGYMILPDNDPVVETMTYGALIEANRVYREYGGNLIEAMLSVPQSQPAITATELGL